MKKRSTNEMFFAHSSCIRFLWWLFLHAVLVLSVPHMMHQSRKMLPFIIQRMDNGIKQDEEKERERNRWKNKMKINGCMGKTGIYLIESSGCTKFRPVLYSYSSYYHIVFCSILFILSMFYLSYVFFYMHGIISIWWFVDQFMQHSFIRLRRRIDNDWI